MKNKIMALALAAIGALGLISATATAGAGDASAVAVQQLPGRVFLTFTHAETKQIAASGIQSVFDSPAARDITSYSLASDSRYQTWYVPSRNAYYGHGLATRMVREAAAHPNGVVWVSINTNGGKPLTLWTRW
ncbi:hypothetical protein [Gordonia humi]|uniref:Uncharacterized protein n=1 Tax=Gordonia humi TaxID=686429 RepID=A0A840EQ40_9ACTN|nr:hypothetical protein [Gordonia humi]MBB4133812.1 hypothetical protein [Gordonia humi]